jgi:hypothetical protein
MPCSHPGQIRVVVAQILGQPERRPLPLVPYSSNSSCDAVQTCLLTALLNTTGRDVTTWDLLWSTNSFYLWSGYFSGRYPEYEFSRLLVHYRWASCYWYTIGELHATGTLSVSFMLLAHYRWASCYWHIIGELHATGTLSVSFMLLAHCRWASCYWHIIG